MSTLLNDILQAGVLAQTNLNNKGVDCTFGRKSDGKDTLYDLADKISEISSGDDFDGCGYIVVTVAEGRTFQTAENSLICDSGAKVDYGDGTVTTLNGQFNHQYEHSGSFKIRFTGVTGVSANCFQGNMDIIKAYFPDITSINYSSNINIFKGCYNLTEVGIPNLTTISTSKAGCNNNMFDSCGNLITVNIPLITTININYENNMFYNCTSLVNISLPQLKTITSTNNAMFMVCENLKEVYLPAFESSTSSLMEKMFVSCEELEVIHLPKLNNITAETNEMFYGCNKLEKVIFESNLRLTSNSVNNMFKECSNIIEIDFGELEYWDNTASMFKIGGSYLNPQILRFGIAYPPAIDSPTTLSGCDGTIIIIIPNGSTSNYTMAQNYPNYNINRYEEVHG